MAATELLRRAATGLKALLHGLLGGAVASGAATAAKWGLKFPVLLDADKSVSKLYDLGSMPATVLIDRDGKVRYLHRGYRDGVEDTYERQIRELVKE